MVPAQLNDPLSLFLVEIEQVYARKVPNERIRCLKLMVEDHYEVDPRFSVGESLGDMMKVQVEAVYAEDNHQNTNNKTHTNQKAENSKENGNISHKEGKKHKNKDRDNKKHEKQYKEDQLVGNKRDNPKHNEHLF